TQWPRSVNIRLGSPATIRLLNPPNVHQRTTFIEPLCNVSPPTEQLKKTLVCVASGFYPDHVGVSWTVNGQSVTKGVASDHPALRVGDKYQITSRLRVEAREWYTGGNIFTCNCFGFTMLWHIFHKG
uniref:Ig-like domain-containing protein n=1 Tax=Gadus morhua TaxID=8049 RepID=A0A8C4YV40_GADMO